MLKIQNVSRRVDHKFAIRDISMSVVKKDTMVILGPSGCGKTTLLRLIAGFDSPDTGSIIIDEQTVSKPGNTMPPSTRQIGMVFQDLALWPHMTVSRNVAFSLSGRRLRRSEKARRVAEILEQVAMNGHRFKYPRQLSAGEQQRVALARALVHHPKLLLLDEPFSSLEPSLTKDLCRMVRAIQEQLGFAVVYVTHDRTEAFQVADRLAIMQQGRFVQVGAPEELRTKPVDEFVAGFVRE